MASFKLIWQCVFGPKVYRKYHNPNNEGGYQPYTLEKWTDSVISSLYLIMNLGLYASPLLATILYRKGYFILDGFITMAKMLSGLGLTVVAVYFARGVSRASNPAYREFHTSLLAAIQDLNKDTKKSLKSYDFEFHAMPVDFKWNDYENGDETKNRTFVTRPSMRRPGLDRFVSLPCHIAAYLAAHTFGIRMVYPGSIRALEAMMSPVLLEGRIKLVEQEQGIRYKLRTRDGNDVDSMFVDRRSKKDNGHILVICSEGNAGFYEVGIMSTPIEAGYSVLGWNHPGFGGSTGMPYPDQELNAMDTVMQFAIHYLNFQPENILLFGWSIGGFPVTWAAMNYPDVRGVILDASFDDLLHLAIPRMPSSWGKLVRLTIRDHINLNNAEQLVKYSGPVLLIRRTDDEVICTEEMNLSTNRGNDLLVKLLNYRYPNLMTEDVLRVLNLWLAADSNTQRALWSKHGVSDDECQQMLLSYVSENSGSFPMLIGEGMDTDIKVQLLLFLASKYMTDIRTTHCTPLPASMFRTPWHLIYEPEYVQL